jgi:hypothetical protein
MQVIYQFGLGKGYFIIPNVYLRREQHRGLGDLIRIPSFIMGYVLK